MVIHTRSQKLAQAAFPCVQNRKRELGERFKEYTTFAKKFPALVHTCGLAQSLAFALAKKETDYIKDLTVVLHASGYEIADSSALQKQSSECDLSSYIRLSRDTLKVAEWLKRYVEAVGEDS